MKIAKITYSHKMKRKFKTTTRLTNLLYPSVLNGYIREHKTGKSLKQILWRSIVGGIHSLRKREIPGFRDNPLVLEYLTVQHVIHYTYERETIFHKMQGHMIVTWESCDDYAFRQRWL